MSNCPKRLFLARNIENNEGEGLSLSSSLRSFRKIIVVNLHERSEPGSLMLIERLASASHLVAIPPRLEHPSGPGHTTPKSGGHTSPWGVGQLKASFKKNYCDW